MCWMSLQRKENSYIGESCMPTGVDVRVMGLKTQGSQVFLTNSRKATRKSDSFSCSVVPDSLWPRGLQPTRLFCPWILQVRTLEWAAIPLSRGSSWPRDWTWVSCTAGRFFNFWATREEKWSPKGTNLANALVSSL